MDMDKLTSISEVVSALATFRTAVTDLGKTISGDDVTLSTNRAEVKAAWESENATAFDTQYGELIGYINEAYNSLVKYQAKIEAVVAEFQGFDATIQKAE